MKKIEIVLTGNSPLLMHSARLSDPLDPATKRLAQASKKRSKTEDDHRAVAEAEWFGGLYHDPDIGPYIPGDNIMATLVAAARLDKLGTKVTRGLVVQTDVNPLAYPGPRDAVELFKDGRFIHRASVKVMASRVIRTRPVFHAWQTSAVLMVDESQLDTDQVRHIATNAGLFIGIGDWRPRFGRFSATVEEVS